MLLAVLVILGAFLFLAVVEYVSRRLRSKAHSEVTRKITHMTAGCVAAVFPFIFKWWEIGAISLLCLFVVSISIRYNILRSIHSVNRHSLGEVFFALAIGALAFLDGSPWVFAAAMLNLGLADGAAAIIGVKYGKRTRYEVFGYRKSVVGTLAFFVTSFLITGAYLLATHRQDDMTLLMLVPVVATLVENFAVVGTDNLFVPLVVAGLLKFF